MKITIAKIARSFPAALILTPLILVIFAFSACKKDKTTTADPNTAIIEDLSKKIIALRAETTDYEEIATELTGLREKAASVNEALFMPDPADRALSFTTNAFVNTVEAPQRLTETETRGGIEYAFVKMVVQGPWDAVCSLVSQIENNDGFHVDLIEISTTELIPDALVELRLTAPKRVITRESRVATEEEHRATDEEDSATPENKIESLKNKYEELTRIKEMRAAAIVERDELRKAFENLDAFGKDKIKVSEFLIGLQARWPIGVPEIRKVRVRNGVVSIATDKPISEITEMWNDFYNEMNSMSKPIIVNLNPVFPGLVDGRRLDVSTTADSIVFSIKGLTFLQLGRGDVAGFVRGKDVIYYTTPFETDTAESVSATSEWKPRRVKSLGAITILYREKKWEIPVECASPATNIVIDSRDRIVFGCGPKLFMVSPDNGAIAETVGLKGEAIEIAVGADDRMIIKQKNAAGVPEWRPITAAEK